MKNNEVLDFGFGLGTLRRELEGRVFAHAVALNLQNLEKHTKSLEKAREASPEMKEYIQKFEELKKQSSLDKEGKPVIKMDINPQTGEQAPFYDIPGSDDPKSEFSKKREALIKQYNPAIDKHTAMLKEWNEVLLEKESTFEVIKIDLDDIPNNINTDEMKVILPMIND